MDDCDGRGWRSKLPSLSECHRRPTPLRLEAVCLKLVMCRFIALLKFCHTEFPKVFIHPLLEQSFVLFSMLPDQDIYHRTGHNFVLNDFLQREICTSNKSTMFMRKNYILTVYCKVSLFTNNECLDESFLDRFTFIKREIYGLKVNSCFSFF